MQYEFDKEKLAVLEKKGPEVYYVNKDNGLEEVELYRSAPGSDLLSTSRCRGKLSAR